MTEPLGPDIDDEPRSEDLDDQLRRAEVPEDDFEAERVLAGVKSRLLGTPSDPVDVDRYRITGRLGSGGFGVVYRAHDPDSDRTVAIKLVHPSSDDPQTARPRMVREAQALARLNHPNVVSVLAVGTHDDRVYLVMEFLDGQDLRAWLTAQPRRPLEIVDALMDASRGVAAAHHAGLVHRDLKPSNVIVTRDGQVKVLDFGLASVPRDVTTGQIPRWQNPSAMNATLTRTGTVMGTPAYMAPEQHEGKVADARADQYALALTLYEALLGRYPFEGRSNEGLLADKLRRPPPLPTGRISARVEQVVLRAMSAEPGDRYPDISAWIDAVARARRPRGRWLWLAATAAASSAALGWAMWPGAPADPGPTCAGAERALAGAWDDERRARVRAAFEGVSAPFAMDAWRRVEATLDEYASAYVVAHRDACEATHVRNERSEEALDATMACLGQRRAELAALTEILAEGDLDVVRRAVQATTGLTPLQPCTGPRPTMDLPADPRIADAVADVHRDLARVKALQSTGRYKAALTLAAAATRAARQIDHHPTLSLCLYWEGFVRDKNGDYDGSQRDLEAAFEMAQAAGVDRVAADAAGYLIYVVGHRKADPDAGRTWYRHAEAALQRSGGGGPLDARLIRNLGSVYLRSGEYELAAEQFARSLALNEPRLGAEHPETVADLNNLGVTAYHRGRWVQSERYHRQALAGRRKTLGPWHPEVATSLNNLGLALANQGRLEEATTNYEQALELWERSIGEDYSMFAAALSNLGLALNAQKRFDEALEHFERALKITRRTLGDRHPQVAQLLTNLGVTTERQGRLDEAASYHEQALAVRRDTQPPRHPDVGVSTANLAFVRLAQGRYDDAKSGYLAALDIWSEAYGGDHPYVAFALDGLGEVELGRGDPDAAVSPLQRAMAMRETLGSSPAELAETRFNLARALVESRGPGGKDGRRAHALAEQALVGLREAGEAQAVQTVHEFLVRHWR